MAESSQHAADQVEPGGCGRAGAVPFTLPFSRGQLFPEHMQGLPRSCRTLSRGVKWGATERGGLHITCQLQQTGTRSPCPSSRGPEAPLRWPGGEFLGLLFAKSPPRGHPAADSSLDAFERRGGRPKPLQSRPGVASFPDLLRASVIGVGYLVPCLDQVSRSLRLGPHEVTAPSCCVVIAQCTFVESGDRDGACLPGGSGRGRGDGTGELLAHAAGGSRAEVTGAAPGPGRPGGPPAPGEGAGLC